MEHTISVMIVFNMVWYLLLLCLLAYKPVFTSDCTNEASTAVRKEWENDFAKFSYSYNITEGSVYSDKFDLLFEVCEGQETTLHCTFFWRKQSKNVSFKKLILGNETVCFARQIEYVGSSVITYEIQVSQMVRRSLTFLKLSITDNKKRLEILSLICIDVLYPPTVTSLTVDGHEVNGDYFIHEGQEVTVTCFFDKGNPPAPVRLLDKQGRHLSSSKVHGQVINSFVARCEDEWPVVLCKSEGSQNKRSVSFIVRCPPLFLEKSTKIVRRSLTEGIIFLVRTHTAIEECLLTPLSLEDNKTRKVNCTLSGNTPNLHLHLHLRNITRGRWMLTLRNEVGFANTSLIVTDVSNRTSDEELF